MNIEKYILQKVKLYTNKYYFHLFQTILINLSKNISLYDKQTTLSQKLENNKVKHWFFIMQIVLDKFKSKENSLIFENNLNINSLVFSYLVKLCKLKIRKLIKLSIRENAPLDILLRLYLDLCDQIMYPEKYELLKKEKEKKKKKQKDKDKKGIEILLETTYKNKNNNNSSTQTSLMLTSRKLKLNKKRELNKIRSSNDIYENQNKSNSEEDESEEDENNVQKKYGIGKIKLSYCNSLSRLFIGETDEKTVKEKYLKNITVKKEQKLNGVKMTKAESYKKGIMNEIYKEKNRNKGVIIDQNMVKIIDKFNKDQKILEDYKKCLKLKMKTNSNKNNIKILKYINLNKNNTINTNINNSSNKKVLHNSMSCSYFVTNSKNINNKNNNKKSRNNLKLSLHYNSKKNGSYLKNILLSNYNIFHDIDNISKNQNKSVGNKFKLKSKNSNSLQNRNRKIAKYLRNKFKEYKNTFFSQKKYGLQNYMNKKDFFYNNEYLI